MYPNEFPKQQAVQYEITVPKTPQQNGVADWMEQKFDVDAKMYIMLGCDIKGRLASENHHSFTIPSSLQTIVLWLLNKIKSSLAALGCRASLKQQVSFNMQNHASCFYCSLTLTSRLATPITGSVQHLRWYCQICAEREARFSETTHLKILKNCARFTPVQYWIILQQKK